MHLVFGHDDEIASWVGEHLGTTIHPPYSAIGVMDKEGLRGGIVFNDWNKSNIEITIYGPGTMQRGVIRGAYHYAFIQCGACRVTAKTRRSNVVMKKLLPRLSFEFEGVMKRYYGVQRENDALVFRLDPVTAIKWM